MKNTLATDSHSYESRRLFRMRLPHAGSRGDGQSLVELALIWPLVLVILFGTLEVARFTWASIEASNAARAGAQYGAQSHTFASDTAGIKVAAQNDGVNLSGLVASTSNYCVCSTATSTTITCGTTTLAACPSPAIILEYVQVNTTAAVNPLFHYPGLPATFTAQGQAIMEVEQ